MSFSDPPTPPNPIATAAAATTTNVGTAVANAFLNNTNQITPNGSLNYDPTGNYAWHDPVTGATYNIPTFTATQTLSPEQQAIKDQGDAAKYNLAGLANAQSGRLSNLLGTELDLSGAPAAGDPSQLANVPDAATTLTDVGGQQRALGDTGSQQSTFGDAGDITRTYGPADNFSADRSRVEEALYGRLDPQLQIERTNIEQRLADQGIRYGSDAYTNAMMDYNRQANDARLAVTQAGGAEQQRLMDEAAKKAGFENDAQKQAYDQAYGRGTFANTAQAQNFQQGLQTGTFANQAQKDAFQQEALKGQFKNSALAQQLAARQGAFSAANATRNQFIAEKYAQRNQPINEISALLSGSQVSDPKFVNTPTSSVPTTDVAGIINNKFSQDLSVYQQQSANFNSLMGGIFGAIGGLGKGVLSDRREKENVHRIGTVFAASSVGDVDHDEKLPIYEYAYKDDPASVRHIGPMAQDVEKIDPRAVSTRGGKKYIDPDRVMGSILKAA